MLRRGYLLLYVLIASLLATATVHAQEFASPFVKLECAGYVHGDGDSDQSQGDADKAVPHHHTNCQNAPIVAPASAVRERQLRPMANSAPNYVATMAHLWSDDPGLRPPIA